MKIFSDDIEEAIRFRRVLHKNPELSGEEYQTALRIKEQLDAEGIYYEQVLETGVLAIIDGAHAGATVALRADIDALPITEDTGLSFKSETDGVMHACGHDAHTAMMMSACKILNRNRDKIHGRVLIIFQPSEEDAPLGGAGPMIETGIFDKYRPDAIFAQHVWPNLELGKFGIMSGPIMGNSDRILIKIQGKGGHAAVPNEAVDPIVIASQVISNIQTIISRNVDPFDPAVITIGTIEGGVAANIIADSVNLRGSMRSLSEKSRTTMVSRLTEVVENTARTLGGDATLEVQSGYPATINDPSWASVLRETVIDEYGEAAAPALRPSLAGEDFSKFLLKFPGAYYWLGMQGEVEQFPLHHPKFDVNEASFEYGINMLLKLTVNALEKLNDKSEG